MAATARTSTPQTEPFPPLDTTASTAAVAPTLTAGGDVSNLLRPPASPRLDVQAAGTSPKSDKQGFSPRTSPFALTGAAAMAELKRRSKQPPASPQQSPGGPAPTTPNPGVEAMQMLLGGGRTSKPSDAPAPDKLSEPLRKAAEQMHVSDNGASTDAEQQASPVSMASFGTVESSVANTTTATAPDTSAPAPHFVAEPAQMTDHTGYRDNNGHLAPEDQDGNKAFSYPGPPPMDQNQEGGPTRGMSLPGYGQASPRSPVSNRRHKCPYCSTDFTRHHNLKSHLLTHSQEKPYVCQTCQARFRRLHDLKRHTKLHTGERPHTCDKCGRRFARGDALARHNKGPGGCAGRRSSFGGDDDYGPEGGDPNAMEGVEYAGADDDDDVVHDGHGRRISEPNRNKRQHLETVHDSNRAVYRQHSSTYPPAPTRPVRGNVGGDMGPPTVVHPSSSAANSPHDMSGQPSPTPAYYGSGQVFAEPGSITQSPRALSPGQTAEQSRMNAPDASAPGQLARNRSASLTTQFQQAHFGRTSAGRTPPPAPSQFPSNPSGGALLPPLGSGNPSSNGRVHSTSAPTPSASNMAHHQSMPHGSGPSGNPESNAGSLSSHGRSSGSSMRDLAGQDPNDIWAYVRSLEQRLSRMSDEYELRMGRLQEEVITLRGQVSNAASYSSEMGPRY